MRPLILIALTLLAACARDPAPEASCFALIAGTRCDFAPLAPPQEAPNVR